jgi:hypothetical protein
MCLKISLCFLWCSTKQQAAVAQSYLKVPQSSGSIGCDVEQNSCSTGFHHYWLSLRVCGLVIERTVEKSFGVTLDPRQILLLDN